MYVHDGTAFYMFYLKQLAIVDMGLPDGCELSTAYSMNSICLQTNSMYSVCVCAKHPALGDMWFPDGGKLSTAYPMNSICLQSNSMHLVCLW